MKKKARKFGPYPIGGVLMFPCKHITPDHPEFATTAAAVKPIEDVHRFSQLPRVQISAEIQDNHKTCVRRRETVDKLF